ncbi:MAG: Hsp20/alpha crystallin family protein [Burkholderiaceae bacterium]|nr:Hsp20/alpha crystallin family protein [Burkholderiaceae bacterium]
MNLVLRSRNGYPTPFAFRRASGSLDRLFDNMVEDFFAPGGAHTRAAGTQIAAHAPRINLSESATAYVVEAELPGVAKENVKISVDGNVVTLEAEVKRDTERKEGETVVFAERRTEKFARSFTLASEVDDEKSVAKLENGVLTLTLPKKAELLPKQIQVQ